MKYTLKLTISVFAIISIALLTFYSQTTITKITVAIITCGTKIIPNLFPSMCISLFLIKSGIIYLFPKKSISFLLFTAASISGYPVGANILKELYINGKISEKELSKTLPSFINSGPAFTIGVVGVAVYGSVQIGIRIYFSLLLTNFIIFIITKTYKINYNRYNKPQKLINCFNGSIVQTAQSIINICAYIIFFASISALITQLVGTKISNYFLIILEISNGILNVKNMYLSCFLIGMGGLSVYMQIISILHDVNIKWFRLIIIRIISSLLSVIVLYVINLCYPLAVKTISNISCAPQAMSAGNMPVLIIIIISAIIFSVSITQSRKC